MEYAHVAFAQESRHGSQVDSIAFQPRFHVRVLTISDAMPTTLAPDALCGSQFGWHCADAGPAQSRRPRCRGRALRLGSLRVRGRPWGGRKARCRGQKRILTDLLTRAGAINLARLATLSLHHGHRLGAIA